jgi:ferrochelatase
VELILQTRPKNQQLTQKWWDEGSPLVVISKRMHEKVKQLMMFLFHLAMRYGNPSFYLDYKIHDQGVTEVMLFPLYPQHAMASTTTILELAEEHRKIFPNEIYSSCFYNKPDYLQNLADSIKGHLEGYDYDHIIFLPRNSRTSHSQNRYY